LIVARLEPGNKFIEALPLDIAVLNRGEVCGRCLCRMPYSSPKSFVNFLLPPRSRGGLGLRLLQGLSYADLMLVRKANNFKLFGNCRENFFHFRKLDRPGESLAVHNKERSAFNAQLLSQLHVFSNGGFGGGAVAIGVEFI
jgi:hypothetical protein